MKANVKQFKSNKGGIKIQRKEQTRLYTINEMKEKRVKVNAKRWERNGRKLKTQEITQHVCTALSLEREKKTRTYQMKYNQI